MGTYDRLHQPVLVLNASYEPINVCAARRALILILKGVASAEEHAPANVHSFNRSVSLPSVIRLLEYRRIPQQSQVVQAGLRKEPSLLGIDPRPQPRDHLMRSRQEVRLARERP